MKHQYRIDFRAAVDQLLHLYQSRNSYQEFLHEMNNKDVQILLHESVGKRITVHSRYRAMTDIPLPSCAKALVGSGPVIEQKESWDAESASGKIEILIGKIPGSMRCHSTLEQNASGCSQVFNWDLNFRLPVFGRKVEKIIAENMARKSHEAVEIIERLLKSPHHLSKAA